MLRNAPWAHIISPPVWYAGKFYRLNYIQTHIYPSIYVHSGPVWMVSVLNDFIKERELRKLILWTEDARSYPFNVLSFLVAADLIHFRFTTHSPKRTYTTSAHSIGLPLHRTILFMFQYNACPLRWLF